MSGIAEQVCDKGLTDFQQSFLLDRNAFVSTESGLRGFVRLYNDLAGWCQLWFNNPDEPMLDPIHYRAFWKRSYQPAYTDAVGNAFSEFTDSHKLEYKRFFKLQDPNGVALNTAPALDSGDQLTENFTRMIAPAHSDFRILEQTSTRVRVAVVSWRASLVGEPIGFTKPGQVDSYSLLEPENLSDWAGLLLGKIGPLGYPTSTAFVFENAFGGGLLPHINAEDVPGSMSYALDSAGNAILLSSLPPESPGVLGPSDSFFTVGHGRFAGIKASPSATDFGVTPFTYETASDTFTLRTRFRHHRWQIVKLRTLNVRKDRLLTLHRVRSDGNLELSCAREIGSRLTDFYIIAGSKFSEVLAAADPQGFIRQVYWNESAGLARAMTYPIERLVPSIFGAGWDTLPPETAPFGSTC